MAIHQVTPRPTKPQPFPKPELYEAIAALNRDMGTVIEDFNRLRDFRFNRQNIDAFIVRMEDLRSWANSEFLERQHRRELKDWAHFSSLNRRHEQLNKDPDDVLLDAEHRLEEHGAVAEARGLRRWRERAMKRLVE